MSGKLSYKAYSIAIESFFIHRLEDSGSHLSTLFGSVHSPSYEVPCLMFLAGSSSIENSRSRINGSVRFEHEKHHIATLLLKILRPRSRRWVKIGTLREQHQQFTVWTLLFGLSESSRSSSLKPGYILTLSSSWALGLAKIIFPDFRNYALLDSA